MTGIERIIDRIVGDTTAEADAQMAQAKREAADIAAGYDRQIEALEAESLPKRERAAAVRQEQLCGIAELEARKQLLASKQEMLDLAFERALQKLNELDDKQAVELNGRLAAQAARTGLEKVVLSPAQHKKLAAKVVTAANKLLAAEGRPASLAPGDKPGSHNGGVMLIDGAVEINCAYETIVRLMRESLASEVAALLFAPATHKD